MGSGIGAPDTFLHGVTGSELNTGLTLKPEPGPSPTFIFEGLFRPENQIYRVCQIGTIVILRGIDGVAN